MENVLDLKIKAKKQTLNFDHTSFFTPSKSFTPSKKFTKSDEFSESSEFSNSIKFTKSETFSISLAFSNSNSFSQSYIQRNAPINPKDSEDGNKLGTGAIAGIAVGAAAAVAIIVVVAVFLFKKFKNNIIDEEDIETLDGTQNTTYTDNPIYNKNAEDDPFKEDF